MKLISRVLAVLLCSAVLSPAHAALVDLRFSLHELTPQHKDELSELNSAALPPFEKLKGYSADAFASVPAMPVSLGVRYERFSSKESNAAGKFDARMERTSVLIVKRLVDTGVYAGVVATVGFNNKFDYKVTQGALVTPYKSTSEITGSLGAELGFKLSILRAGIEGGYLYAPMGNLKYANSGLEYTNAQGEPTKIDLSGTYVRAVVGFGF